MASKAKYVRRDRPKLSRKQQRKEKRNQKKIRRNDFFSKKKSETIQLGVNKDESTACNKSQIEKKGQKKLFENDDASQINNSVPTTEQIRKKERKEQKKIEKDMVKHRNKQLLEANIEEDRVIKKLEKVLGLDKRKTKSKSIPKSFAEDGLDYLLEICNPETMEQAVATKKELDDMNDEFKEDFTLMLDSKPSITTKSRIKGKNADIDDDSDSNSYGSGSDLPDDLKDGSVHYSSDDNRDSYSDSEDGNQKLPTLKKKSFGQIVLPGDSDGPDTLKRPIKGGKKIENLSDKTSITNNSKAESKTTAAERIKRKSKESSRTSKKLKKNISPVTTNESEDSLSELDASDNEECENEVEGTNIKGAVKINPDGTWEDIYGRLRAANGSVITSENKSKYVPPAMRNKLSKEDTGNEKRIEKTKRLKKQLKGMLNRLAESNMHSIATQMEDLYTNNSRNDMNDTLTNLMLESLVSNVLTPERLLIEHILLLAILHANVGIEVGAHFLQTVVKKFDEYLHANLDVENKSLENIVNILAQLYNFKLFDCKLIYEILRQLTQKFTEKEVECILHILRSIGFYLRKEDPLALKSLILELQKQAANVSDEEKMLNARVKFMLDILLAIKNNNVSKIPNYDISYSEHLRKVMKGYIRKGNYISQLNINLDDLLKADERGRWWVVGSAWTSNDLDQQNKPSVPGEKPERISTKLLELARKQKMNTDTRRNIFCVIMSAEDYLDAFEKILHLGLKGQQEREIVTVILHCCLQEKNYNPYYAYLAQKFCDYDRKYQMTVKYSIWDKLKALSKHSGSQISNLAKLLIHLFIEKVLPISTLKIVQFGELDKATLRFMRQTLVGILLHENVEACLTLFAKVSGSDKLKLFRESLRLFIHHFLLKNLKSEEIPEEQKILLETRIKMVERALASKENRMF